MIFVSLYTHETPRYIPWWSSRGAKIPWSPCVKNKTHMIKKRVSRNSLFTRNWCLPLGLAWLGSSIFPFACTRKKSKGESRIRGEHTPTHAGPASAWPLVFWGYGAHTCGPHPPHFLHRKNLGPRIHLAAPSTHESQKSPVRARLMEGGFVYVAPDAPARPSLA